MRIDLDCQLRFCGSTVYFESQTAQREGCAALDRQIDRLVYDLYGLTEEEIQIVEQ